MTSPLTVAATIAESPSFATRGSIANVSIGLSLAKIRWKKAIEHQITLLHIQKNSKSLLYGSDNMAKLFWLSVD